MNLIKELLLIERNVINQKEIDNILTQLMVGDERIDKWLRGTFRKWLINQYPNTQPYQAKPNDPEWMHKSNDLLVVQPNDRDVSSWKHVIDYLRTIPAHKSINMSVEQVIQQVKKWDEQLSKQTATDEQKKAAEAGVEILKTYKNGFYWANLTTDKALEHESAMMKHCVGQKGQQYCTQVSLGNTLILSLRDKTGQAHVTVEVNKPNKIKQIKGPANSGVKHEYQKYVKDILKNGIAGLKFEEFDDLINIGIIEVKGVWYDIYQLPKGLTIVDNLDLSNTPITSLPDNLKVGGALYLSNTKITSLPDNLKVGSGLSLSNTKITSLPDNLTVGGWLDLSNTPITSLPDNLKVGSDLYLSNTPITSLPDNLTVSGNLSLSNTPITSLPDNLTVSGNLYLNNTKLTSLPDDLTVSGGIGIIGFKRK